MGAKHGSPLERFWRFITPGDPYKCWEWEGPLTKFGYGRFTYSRNISTAHVAAWLIFRGPTNGMHVLHRCDNPPCVNPNHLWLGTQRDNMQDMFRKKRHRYITKPHVRGTGHFNGNAVFTPEQVLKIRQLHASGKFSQLTLARIFEVSATAIRDAATRTTYRNVP